MVVFVLLVEREVGVVVGLHKLSVGLGYEYLNRNEAVFDATGRGHGSLADSCSAKGVPPRMGIADGLAAVGVLAGDVVSSDQVKLLLWAGLDPRADEQLGRRFSVFGHEPTPFEIKLAGGLDVTFHPADWESPHLTTTPTRQPATRGTHAAASASRPLQKELHCDQQSPF